jgi:hypothetical protein
MFNSRIVSAIGVAAIASVLTAGGAMAQFVVMEPVLVPVGPPLPLLAGLNPPHEHRAYRARAFAHERAASRTSRRIAARKLARSIWLASKTHHHPMLAAQTVDLPAQTTLASRPVDPPAQTTAEASPKNALLENALPENALPENAWATQPAASSQTTQPDAASAADNAAPAAQAAAADSQAAPAAQVAAADSQATPTAVVVGGQTVDVATPDQTNAIDLAADDRHASAVSDNRTDPDPPAQRVLAAPVVKDANSVGSASWIAQVLAAFGGAVAAGVVAWFLIGGSPRRTYG